MQREGVVGLGLVYGQGVWIGCMVRVYVIKTDGIHSRCMTCTLSSYLPTFLLSSHLSPALPLLPLYPLFLFFLSSSPQDMYLQHCLSLEEYFNLRLHDLSLAAGRIVARHDLVDVSRLGM